MRLGGQGSVGKESGQSSFGGRVTSEKLRKVLSELTPSSLLRQEDGNFRASLGSCLRIKKDRGGGSGMEHPYWGETLGSVSAVNKKRRARGKSLA